MSHWNRLPAEILSRIFEIVKRSSFTLDFASNLFPLFEVCKAWRTVALRVGYHTIIYFGEDIYGFDPESHVLHSIENELAGHSTRILMINSSRNEQFEQVFFHFAIYCPHVTSLYCNRQREFVWTTLSKSLYFKKLTEIPGPEEESEMEEYNACAWHYKDQLQKIYALAYHPLDPRLKLEVHRLQQFPKTKSLIIYWTDPTCPFYFDEIIDACPHATYLRCERVHFRTYGKEWTNLVYNKELYEPHMSLVELEAILPFNSMLFDYLIHKFPNLQKGEISIQDRHDTKREQDQYLSMNLGKLIEFTSESHLTITISISLERLKEALENACVKSLKLEFGSWQERTDLVELMLIRDGAQIDYPAEHRNMRYLVTSDMFKNVWCPISANTTSLRIEIARPSNEYVTFGIFMDIFKYAGCLTNLFYKIQETLCVDSSFDNYKVCGSLDSLTLHVVDIQEGVYPVFSKCCPQLTKLKLKLLTRMIRKVTRIDMPESNFELFQLFICLKEGIRINT